MAKPDLQATYVDPATGVMRRLAGKLGLPVAALVDAANDGAAASAGVPIGGLYHNDGAVRLRRT